MKNWLKRQNKKLLKKITESSYHVEEFNHDLEVMRHLYEGDSKSYIKGAAKLMTNAELARENELTKCEVRRLKFNKALYFITILLSKIIGVKSDKYELLQRKTWEYKREVDVLRKKHVSTPSYVFNGLERDILKLYGEALDGLRK